MASNHKKDIDHVFKTKLENHCSEVPTSVWSKISAELDQSEIVKPAPAMESRSRKFNISWFAKIAAGLLLVGFIIWKVQPDRKVSLTAENKSTSEPIQSIAKNEQELPSEKEILIDPANASVSPMESQTASVPEEPSSRIEEKRVAHKVKNVVYAPVYQPIDSQPQQIVEETIAMSDVPETETFEPELEAIIETEEAPMEVEALTSAPVLEDESDNPVLIADSDVADSDGLRSRERPKILSGVLNFVANNLQVGGSPVVEFNETDQGILQVDMKGLFNK